MAHALNNASHTSVCTELGITRGNDRTQTSLTRHASINKWSFYRPGASTPNATTHLMELTAPSNNDKLGDFRGYNHSASTPYTPSDFTQNWGPTGTSFSLTFLVYINEWNIREATAGLSPYIVVKYYATAALRNGKSGHFDYYSVALSETSNTPPTGHTNTQTLRPAGASQIVTDPTFLVSNIPAGNIIYCDIFIGNSTGATEYARFGSVLADGHVDVTTVQNVLPYITASGNLTPAPTGQTAAFPLVYTSSTACADTNISVAIGGSTLQFYVNAQSVGALGNRVYNLTSVTCKVTYDGAVKTLFTAGAIGTTKRYVNDTLPTGKSWGYNKVAYITLESPTWGTTYVTC